MAELVGRKTCRKNDGMRNLEEAAREGRAPFELDFDGDQVERAQKDLKGKFGSATFGPVDWCLSYTIRVGRQPFLLLFFFLSLHHRCSLLAVVRDDDASSIQKWRYFCSHQFVKHSHPITVQQSFKNYYLYTGPCRVSPSYSTFNALRLFFCQKCFPFASFSYHHYPPEGLL